MVRGRGTSNDLEINLCDTTASAHADLGNIVCVSQASIACTCTHDYQWENIV